MERKIVYRDSDGVRRTAITDEERPFELRVYTEVEMDEVLESIKRAREAVRPFSLNKHVARIPLTIMERSIHEQWDEDQWKHWLNSPEAAPFRVWQGRV